MRYTDLIFDLYGTLVDIHTEENDFVWEKTALYFGFYGAHYTGPQLRAAFGEVMQRREAQAGQSYECFPDIPFENVMNELFHAKGKNKKELGVNAAQFFRIASIDYIRLYPGVLQALETLRRHGYRLWLLSNAQQVFTAYELTHLGLGEQFHKIFLSSDYGFRKPDIRFFQTLLEEQKLDPRRCLMIGNDRETDIQGAIHAGLDTLYLHTNLTPSHQQPADPKLALGISQNGHYEYEGCDWPKLAQQLVTIW